jgi:hypothetical protein
VSVSNFVSLATVKSWSNLQDDVDDVVLEAALAASCRSVEAWCRRSFSTDIAATARTYHGTDSWTLDIDDFQSTVGLIVKSDAGDNGTYDQTWTITRDYICYPLNGYVSGQTGWPFYTIQATGSRYFPRSGLGSGMRPRIQVTALWGWAAVPEAVTLATMLKAARLCRRKDMPESSGGFDGGGFHMPLVKVSSRDDPDVTALLSPYLKMTGGGGILA